MCNYFCRKLDFYTIMAQYRRIYTLHKNCILCILRITSLPTANIAKAAQALGSF